MKRLAVVSIMVLAGISLLLASCSRDEKPSAKKQPPPAKIIKPQVTTDDIRKEAGELARTTLTYSEQQLLDYKQKITEKLAEYHFRQKVISKKIATLGEQARSDLAGEMENLKEKKAQVDKKVVELYRSSGEFSEEAFRSFREGMDKALEEMDQAYDQTMENIRQ